MQKNRIREWGKFKRKYRYPKAINETFGKYKETISNIGVLIQVYRHLNLRPSLFLVEYLFFMK